MLPYTIDDYEITVDGQIINKHSGRILKGQPNGKGYLRVSIGGHLEFIHRLVAQKHVPNPDGKEQVNHKNGIKTDNRAENLEWVTNQENRNHAMINDLHLKGEQCSWAKLSEENVRFIRSKRKEFTSAEFGEMFGVNPATIRAVLNNQSWKDIK